MKHFGGGAGHADLRSPIQADAIYERRFSNEIVGREKLWKILVENFFQRYVRPEDIVLDMPCGYAQFINNVRCLKKFGLDVNPASATFVSSDVEFVQSSSTRTPFAAETMDVIFISNFFEHLSRDDIVATIRECYRIVRPGGRVLVLQPNIRFAYRDYWMFLDHITPVDDRMLEEAFELNALKLTERIVRFLPFTAKSRLPQAGFLVRAYLRTPPAWRVLGKQSFLVFEKA
jgi:SAM-dependent methyltransferase